MSWIQKLYETYNNCQSQIGYSAVEGERPLLPICHVTTDAHIEIVIDRDGNFRRANLISDSSEAATIVPCTESSASRSGKKPKGHPLCDKLQYVAGDFEDFGGVVTSGYMLNPQEPFRDYLEILAGWCSSEFGHPKARAVLDYVSQKSVVSDLVSEGLLLINENRKFVTKEETERERNAQDIFSIIQERQDRAFVRWVVEAPGTLEPRVWRDKTLWESWIHYYLSSMENELVCYVTGMGAILTTNHPRYIRWKGDSAKLISSNDDKGFTFRGRFTEGDQVCNVSLEVSHKAHYALAWLISRQGYRFGDLAIIAWASSGKPVPQPSDNSSDLLGMDELESDQNTAYTAQNFALKLNQKIQGYSAELGELADIEVMALDSATKGRLAITCYRELTGSEYLQRIENWHRDCSWIHDFGYDRKKGKYYRFVGAPSPYDIAEAAYGKNLDDGLRKATISRILPCIIDGQPLPGDIVLSTARRATKRISLEDREWRKALSIACALFKKYHEKEKYDMALDMNRTTRDYLYGRLLALADDLEDWAQSIAGEKRPTNATRLMQRFSEHPFTTWRTIELALGPYKTRLGPKANKLQRTMDEVMAAFNPDDFLSDKRLSGEFLLGFHAQKESRWNIASESNS